jgi:hypothetical protein
MSIDLKTTKSTLDETYVSLFFVYLARGLSTILDPRGEHHTQYLANPEAALKAQLNF